MAALQPLKIRRGMIRFPLSSKEGNNTNISEKDFDNGKKIIQVIKYSASVYFKFSTKAHIWTVFLKKKLVCLPSLEKERRFNLFLRLLSPLNPEQFAHCRSIIIPSHSHKCIWAASGYDWAFSPSQVSLSAGGDLVLNEAGHCLPEVGGPRRGCFLALVLLHV